MELVIARRWSGEAVAPHARVALAITGDWLEVRVDARLVGDPAPAGPPRALVGLWEHEVVELFVAGAPHDDAAPYVELELGPHGHWLAWSFSGYRARAGDVALAAPPEVTRNEDRWCAVARLPLAALPALPWRVNAFVIHGPPGAREHLVATALGGARPDFHRVADYRTTFGQ